MARSTRTSFVLRAEQDRAGDSSTPRYGQAASMPTLARSQVPIANQLPAAVRKPNLPQVTRERVGTAQMEMCLG